MALRKKQALAISLRKKNLPYSEIRKKLGVSKSTLSYWLRDMPLSRERINELRALSPKRIERYRNTMRAKKEKRLADVFDTVKRDIGTLGKHELFIAGLFLYWGEGSKTKPYTATLTNTDPSMIRFYITWIQTLEVPKEKLKIKLHLYADMDIMKEKKYWQKITGVPYERFQKPYIKRTELKNLTRGSHGHGTCSVVVDNRDISEYILQGLKYLYQMYQP